MTEEKHFDTLDFVIERMHECKPVNLEDCVMREHIENIAWERCGDKSPELIAIDYACSIYSKMLAEDLKYDMPLNIHYADDGIRITRRGN